MIRTRFCGILLILAIFVASLCQVNAELISQGADVTPLHLSQALHAIKNTSDQFTYYALSLKNKNMTQGQALTISALSSQRTFISMYINILEQPSQDPSNWSVPTTSNYDIKCSEYNIATCPIFDPQPNTMLYIAVAVRDMVSYMVLADRQEVATIGQHNMEVKLVDRFAAVYQLELKGKQAGDTSGEVVVRAEYNPGTLDTEYKMFTLRAGLLPNNSTQPFTQSEISYSLGAYSQQLKLPNTQNTYYLIITGQSGLSLTLLTYKPTSVLTLSTPTQYLYQSSREITIPQIKQFVFNGSMPNNTNQYGIYIDKLRGAGTIVVWVCNSSYSFKPELGYSRYMVIPATVMTCSGPTIRIQLANVTGQLGVRLIIQPYQNMQDDETVYLGQERIQVLSELPSSCTTYVVEPLPIDSQQKMLVRFSSPIAQQNLTIKACTLNQSKEELQCNPVTLKFKSNETNYLYTHKVSQLTQLQVCGDVNAQKNTKNLSYSILVMPFPEVLGLNLDKEVMETINSDEIKLYKVNSQYKSQGQATLQVRVKLINGQIKFNQNCRDTINLSTFCFKNNDNKSAWQYSGSYNLSALNSTDPIQNIMFGVTASSESIYSVVAYIDEHLPVPPGPTPEPLIIVNLHDGANSLTLQKQPLVVSYTSHIIPYNIDIPSGQDLCIEQFDSVSTLLSTPTCSQSSTKFKSGKFLASSLFIRISSQQSSGNGTLVDVSVTIPTITMTKNKYAVLSCPGFCYTTINITNFDWGSPSIVSIRGPGFINVTPETNSTSLKFTSVPFSFTAFLPSGGDLFIQIQEESPNVVSKNKTTYALSYFNDLNVLVPVQDLSTLLINSFGRKFSASWRLYTLNKSQANTFSYSYPQAGDQLLYKSPSYGSASVPLALQNSKQLTLPQNCSGSNKQLLCFFTVFIKNSQDLDLLNDDSDIEINLDNKLDFLTLNLPTIGKNDFGIDFYSALLLQVDDQKVTNGFRMNESMISVQPLSACGALTASLVDSNSVFGFSQEDSSKILSVSTAQPCMYTAAITSCPYPMIFDGVPHQMHIKHQHSMLFNPLDETNSFSLYLWRAGENLSQNNIFLIVSVYSIIDTTNCSSNENTLVSTTLMKLGEGLPIYKTSNDQHSSIKISIDKEKASVYLIKISPETPSAFQGSLPLTLLIKTSTSQLTLPPNSQPIPIIESKDPTLFNHYTNTNGWQLCYISILGSDESKHARIKISDKVGVAVEKQVKMEDKENCLMVGYRGGGSLTNYTVSVSYVGAPAAELLLVYSKQFTQAIQTNHPHTPLYQPKDLLLSRPNSKYGRCYNYDVNNIQSTINIIFYPDNPKSANGSLIYVPGTKLKDKYEVTQIKSVRTGELVTYKVVIQAGNFEEDNVQVCFDYDGGYMTKIVDQFSNYMVLFNQQREFKNVSGQQGSTTLQIFKYIGLTTRPNSSWLVTQISSCSETTNFSLTGSPNIADILTGNSASNQQVYSRYATQVLLSPLNNIDNYFVGVAYSGPEDRTYAVTTFEVPDKKIPHDKWNIGDGKINSFVSEDGKHLVVQLPALIGNISNSTVVKYTIYIASKKNETEYNATKTFIKCPSLKSVGWLTKQKQIFNQSLLNPSLPLFKINISTLPGNNISILGQVQVNQSNSSMPLSYFYSVKDMIVEGGGDEGQQESSESHLGLIFLIIAIAIFMVVLFKFIYKVVKRRMSPNTIQFELQQQNNANAPMVSPSASPPISPEVHPQPDTQTQPQASAPRRQSVGYAEFVEQEIAI